MITKIAKFQYEISV